MKKIAGIWFPDGDEHFSAQMKVGPFIQGKGTYQYKKYQAALKYVPHRGHAVDVGGHVGLWARVIAIDFECVTSYEPLAAHRECFVENVTAENVKLIPFAVGDEAGTVSIHMPADNTGHSHVREGGETCPVIMLDQQKMRKIDFLKIDVEGFEVNVLKGAEKTIKRDRPVIIIEQKPNNAERYGRGQWDAVKLLTLWGMEEAEVISGDHIMVW